VNIERLATMANDIANFFHAETDRNLAIDSISGHLRKFWEPRMRRQIIAYAKSGNHEELSELAHEGVMRLASIDTANV
jgi:formate dehydrogenase subunit delta